MVNIHDLIRMVFYELKDFRHMNLIEKPVCFLLFEVLGQIIVCKALAYGADILFENVWSHF